MTDKRKLAFEDRYPGTCKECIGVEATVTNFHVMRKDRTTFLLRYVCPNCYREWKATYVYKPGSRCPNLKNKEQL